MITGMGTPLYSGINLPHCHMVHHKSHTQCPGGQTWSSAMKTRRLNTGVTARPLYSVTSQPAVELCHYTLYCGQQFMFLTVKCFTGPDSTRTKSHMRTWSCMLIFCTTQFHAVLNRAAIITQMIMWCYSTFQALVSFVVHFANYY